MGLFQKIFHRNDASEEKVGGMEDYMTLVKVYFQASLANKLGITNLAIFLIFASSNLLFMCRL